MAMRASRASWSRALRDPDVVRGERVHRLRADDGALGNKQLTSVLPTNRELLGRGSNQNAEWSNSFRASAGPVIWPAEAFYLRVGIDRKLATKQLQQHPPAEWHSYFVSATS